MKKEETRPKRQADLTKEYRDEALREYVKRDQGRPPRREVLKALDDSLLQYDELYRRLAE